MILNINDFCEYNNLVLDTNNTTLIEKLLKYAQSIVEDYLHYPLERNTYSEVISGVGTYLLLVKNIPVVHVLSLTTNDDKNIPLSDFIVYDKGLISKNRNYIFTYHDIFKIDYIAGYGEVEENLPPNAISNPLSYKKIPDDIYMTTLDIASILWVGHGQNAGVTSKQDEFGNKTFLQVNNFNKYLSRLRRYRNI